MVTLQTETALTLFWVLNYLLKDKALRSEKKTGNLMSLKLKDEHSKCQGQMDSLRSIFKTFYSLTCLAIDTFTLKIPFPSFLFYSHHFFGFLTEDMCSFWGSVFLLLLLSFFFSSSLNYLFSSGVNSYNFSSWTFSFLLLFVQISGLLCIWMMKRLVNSGSMVFCVVRKDGWQGVYP